MSIADAWSEETVPSSTCAHDSRANRRTTHETATAHSLHNNNNRLMISLSRSSCLRSVVRSIGTQAQQEWRVSRYGQDFESLSRSGCERRMRRATDVLIRVHAASINPIDLEQAAGFGQKVFKLMRRGSGEWEDLPLCLGRDFSGVVEATGPSVSGLRVGDQVLGVLSPELRHGSHATHVVADSRLVVRKPESVSHVTAAAVPYAGLTAVSAVCTFAGLNKNNSRFKRVLVIGASGAVGMTAISILRSFGADVTGTCSASAKDWLRTVTPVHDLIDYNDAAEFAEHENKYDVVLNAAPMSAVVQEQGIKCLKKGTNGQYVSLTHPVLRHTDSQGLVVGSMRSACDLLSQNLDLLLQKGVVVKWAFVLPSRAGLHFLTDMMTDKRLEPVVHQVFSFDQMRDAYDFASKGHARGKTVIKMIDD